MTADPATALADHKKDCPDCHPGDLCATGRELWRRSLRVATVMEPAAPDGLPARASGSQDAGTCRETVSRHQQ